MTRPEDTRGPEPTEDTPLEGAPRSDEETVPVSGQDLESRTLELGPGDASDRPPRGPFIGNYRIVRQIGSGGMGVVYEAEQRQPRRRVALKIIRSGRRAGGYHVELFRQEAEVLGRLRHPGIATIFEAGQTPEDEHFFVMELVEGSPLQVYLSRSEIDPGNLSRHLRLMVRICNAISYAHQRGVIHRDLKPSNVMVRADSENTGADAAPEVKVLDFGLARLTDEATPVSRRPTGGMEGTPAYMSPEQALGRAHDIDVRSDVYSLGAMLYEMLTGARPLDLADKDLSEIARAICETPPARPREIRTWLPEDVEAIILKALEKDPDQRYQSAADLAEDIERYLECRPVQARTPSSMYQFRKLVQRNRLPSALLSTLALLVVSFGIMMSILFAAQSRERARAEREAETANRISEVLQDILASANPWQSRTDLRVSEVLDSAGEMLDVSLQEQPEVRAAVLSALGNSYFGLGLYDDAETYLRSSLDLRQRVLGRDHPKTAESAADLSMLLLQQGEELDEAERLSRWALASREDHFGSSSPEAASSCNDLARILLARGVRAEAEPLLVRALEERKASRGSESPEVAESLNNLAAFYQADGRTVEAESLYRRALEVWRMQPGDGGMATAFVSTNLAVILLERGSVEEAERLNREALAILEGLEAESHPLFAQALTGLSVPLQHQGRYEEAAELNERALQTFRKRLGERHEYVATVLNNLALSARARGRYSEAESRYRTAHEILEERLDPSHPITLAAQHNIARILHLQRRMQEANSVYREVLEARRSNLPAGHPDLAQSLFDYGAFLVDQGRDDEADGKLREALMIFKGLGSWQSALAQNTLAVSLAHRGEKDEARSLFDLSEPVLLSDAGVALWKEEALARTATVFREWGEEERARRYSSFQ